MRCPACHLSASLDRARTHCITCSQLDGGQAYTLGLQLLMAKNLSVAVDDAALADTERVEEAAREHAGTTWPCTTTA